MVSDFPIGHRMMAGDAVPPSYAWNALLEDRDLWHRRATERRQAFTDLVHRHADCPVTTGERHPVVENLDDAVRVVEDTIDATSDYAVFGYEACSCRVPTKRTAPAVVEALVGDPVLTQHDDGTVTARWPNDTAIAALVSREALDAFVASYSDLGKTVATIRRTIEERDLDDAETAGDAP